jgi:twitching motility protein PilJ
MTGLPPDALRVNAGYQVHVDAGSVLAQPIPVDLQRTLAWLQREIANVRRIADQQARQNERNQQAILRLLDELSSLADGDLTVQATVTDDITGAIADSINYAIEALRELVATINDTALHRRAPAVTRGGRTARQAVSRGRGRSRRRPTRWARWPRSKGSLATRCRRRCRHAVESPTRADAVRPSTTGTRSA